MLIIIHLTLKKVREQEKECYTEEKTHSIHTYLDWMFHVRMLCRSGALKGCPHLQDVNNDYNKWKNWQWCMLIQSLGPYM